MNYKTLLLKRHNFDSPTFLDNISEHEIESSFTVDEFEELYHMYTNTHDDDDLLIILDEKSTSILNKDQMVELLNVCKKLLLDNDIIYLSNFLDNCESNLILNEEIPDSISHVKFYKALAPNGLYCVISTFKNWSRIIKQVEFYEGVTLSSQLSSAIVSKKVNAVTTWPRVVVPNIDIISDNVENYYTYPCRFEKVYGRTVPNTEQMSFYWFCLGSLIVIFCTWILVKVSPRNKYIFYTKNEK